MKNSVVRFVLMKLWEIVAVGFFVWLFYRAGLSWAVTMRNYNLPLAIVCSILLFMVAVFCISLTQVFWEALLEDWRRVMRIALVIAPIAGAAAFAQWLESSNQYDALIAFAVSIALVAAVVALYFLARINWKVARSWE
jgi:hypothetical protein